MKSFTILIVSCIIVYAKAQQYGPIPPRPQFLGASLVQQPRPVNRQRQINLRPEIQPEQLQPTRVRRPPPQQLSRRPQFPQGNIFEQQRNVIEDSPLQYKPKLSGPTPSPIFQQQTTKNLTPRPVTEDEEEDEDESATTATTPSTTVFPTSFRPNYIQPIQLSQGPISFQKSQFNQPTAFRPSPQIPQPIAAPQTASLQGRQLIRPQQRPSPPQPQLPITRPSPQPIRQNNQDDDEDEEDEEPQYFRQPPSRIQQQKKQPEPVRQQIIDQDQLRQQQPIRQPQRQQQAQPQRQEYQRPVVQREPHVKASNVQREKKPVVQTIRKFHEENEDGSITWGYENDDGSFKEETIGVDCVTRGKYGYYDPDGVKREYTYQTGIPCDKEQQEAEEAASNNEGFIDYTNNKYVFPNGDEIDLEAMVKNRARKPVQRYRN